MGNIQKHPQLILDFFFILVPCFLTVYCCSLASAMVTATTNITTDQSALLALKETNPDHPILAKNWTVSSPICDWFGVTCGSRHHRVTALDISGMGLSGTIPPQLGNLTFLVSLKMGANHFYGEVPNEFGALFRRLRVLDLGSNQLTGKFPPWLAPFKKLEYLYLQNNSFTGLIPPSISNMSMLTTLILSFNSLSGEIPKEIGYLKGLQFLYMENNSFQGAIPKSIGNLTMLKAVHFSANNLSGEIPEEMSKLYGLEEVYLEKNKLGGPIPQDFFNISTLIAISFAENHLSGNLPSTMGYGLPNLQLQALLLNSNNLSGPIPNSISNSSILQFLQLSVNKFTGYIPNSLGDLSHLQCLHLDSNYLQADPSSPLLDFITSLGNCKNLTDLTLSDNPLDGIFPDSFGNLSSKLTRIYAGNCRIRGGIPSGIGNLSSLNLLVLHGNQFTGSLPDSMGRLQHLQRINLSGSKISISLQLFCACQSLGDLNLGQNLIGSAIPECFGNIASLRNLYLHSTGLNSSLPMSFWNLKDLLKLNLSSNSLSGSLPPEIKNLKMAISMDLSYNNFSGDIPLTIENLQDLQALSLAHNQLEGPLPDSIGKMLSLERLDLSYNFLNGSLPMSLQSLQYLTFFNVSFNNLSGEIPFGGPFNCLAAESFISNQALCGAQRFHVPPCPSPSIHRMSIAIILVVVITVAIAVMCFGFFCLRYRRKDKAVDDHEDFSLIKQQRISYYKLVQATDGYKESNLLGIGSFGSVYKGTLEDGRVVAIKVFNSELEGSFKSFDTECDILRNLRHRNLTKVISSCSNSDFMALVLEYMPNGSLHDWLHSNHRFLDIMQRLNISIDVACALQYLHCDNSTPVVHCDLKPSNVLLDEEMVAHVSDFGIAKLLGPEESITHTKTLATLCYLAPEYGLEGIVSTKTDVYSFGIMMLEMFTRKSPSNEMFGENLSLKSWVQDSTPNGLTDIIDPDLLSSSDEKHSPEILACISSVMEVALNCTKEAPKERSNMEDVLAILNKVKHGLQGA